MAFVKIDRLLKKSVKKAQIKDKVEASQVMDEFIEQASKVFGQQIAKKVKPLYLKNKILRVSVISSVLASEIKLKEKILISAINGKFNRTLVRKITTNL